MTKSLRAVRVTRVDAGRRSAADDVAATEEPMEVRINGEAFAVIMRTPGHDYELAAGFLLSEGILRRSEDVALIRHCTDPEHPDRRNVVDVRVSANVDPRLNDRRRVVTSSSCGMCGRVTLDSLQAEAPRIATAWTVPAGFVSSLPDRLATAQRVFKQTGGLHAAGLFTPSGELTAAAEDVGRHNAVDKIIGHMFLRDQVPLGSHLLFVSGRSSFEIVQKAFLAGIPIVGAVSAPSSLAIELADEAGITLAGFVRGESYNIYTHAERIV